MNPAVITVLLFVPFILVAAITGIIYFISGYKRGLYRSLLSLGITVVSILLAILFANLSASALSVRIMEYIPAEEFTEELGYLSELSVSIIEGLLKTALAFFLFALILLIELIVFKIIGNSIGWDKLDMKDPENVKLKLAGMGIRAVDTLLVSLMLLLPVYGTISLISPSAVSISSEIDDHVSDLDDISDVMTAIDSHPLVCAYKAGPGEWTMKCLANIGFENGKINATDSIRVIGKAASIITALNNSSSNDVRAELIADMCDLLEEEAVHQKWCYDLICIAYEELDRQLNDLDADDALELEMYVDILDMDREDFEDSASAILSFTSYALRHDLEDFCESGTLSDIPDDFYYKLGELLNSSDNIIEAKKIVYVEEAVSLFTDDLYGSPRSSAREEAIDFVEDNYGDGEVDNDDYEAEGRVFMAILFGKGHEHSTVELFAEHPLFGDDSLKKLR